MTEQLLTKCPHCGTTFRLSQEHLEIAGGAVRCGSCYQVFHAKEHIVKTAVVEEIREEKRHEEPPDPFEEFELDDGDPYEEAPNWNAEDHPDADLFEESYVTEDEEQTLKEFGLEPEPQPEPKKKKSKKDVDESWAEALLDEMGEDSDDKDDEELIQDDPEEDNDYRSNTGFGGITSSGSAFEEEISKEESEDEISDSFRDMHYESFNKFGIDDDADDEPGSNSKDESWAQKMLEELEAEEAPKAPSLEELSILDDSEPEKDNANNPFSAREISRNAQDAISKAKLKAREEAKKQRESEKAKAPKPPNTKTPANKETDAFFGELTDDIELGDDFDINDMEGMVADDRPLTSDHHQETTAQPDILEEQLAVSELHFGDEPRKSRSGLKTTGLILLNIIAIFGLVAQHAYFHFDDLARQDAYRPWYQKACDRLGCQLPTRVDISKIQGTNLVVRSHPMEPNALVIDAIVYNRANYPQPYPDLRLAFQDINGNPIASRRFSPGEYIQDKQIDFNKMPPDTPVHLTLEIVDPGKSAVNYQIDFLAHNPAN